MKLRFWQRAKEPAPSGECRHLWSNWSEPCDMTLRRVWRYGDETTQEVQGQERRCLQCNLVERRQVASA